MLENPFCIKSITDWSCSIYPASIVEILGNYIERNSLLINIIIIYSIMKYLYCGYIVK